MPSKGPPLPLRPLGRATLARQLLLAREAVPVDAAIARLAGMQAQQPRPPFVGLWTRVEGFAKEDLVGALHRRTVVRATMMRATLHLATAADYVAWRGALQPMLDLGRDAILRGRGGNVDLDAVLTRARALLEERPSTFEEVRQHLLAAHPDADERAMGYAVRTTLPLVLVPTDDRWAFPPDSSFAVAERWLGRPIPASIDPAELVRAYLRAFGPATVADAQRWSGAKGLKAVFDGLRRELVTFTDPRGRELFDLPDAPRPDGDAPAPVRFLPEFDNLVLAHDDRTRLVDDAYRGRIVSKNLQVAATFLVDGRVAGTWKVAARKRSATLTLTPFQPLSPADRAALEAEGDALLRFVEPDAPERIVDVA